MSSVIRRMNAKRVWQAQSASARSIFRAGSRRSLISYNKKLNEKREWSPQLTKIVATIGPTSEQMEMLQPLVKYGLRIMRINFSHATFEEADLRIKNLRNCEGRAGSTSLVAPSDNKNLRAILLDTQGPEIRTGKLQGDDTGKKSITLTIGEEVTLSTQEGLREAGSTDKEIFVSLKSLAEAMQRGLDANESVKVLLDDGAVSLTVLSTDVAAGTIKCRIENTGEIRSRVGVNLPGTKVDLPAMSEKDKVDIRYGLENDVDYVAASFIRDAAGVHEIRAFMKETMTELGQPDAMLPMIISKIENVEALLNFEEILEASDGIMVARGDLGVEIPLEDVINAQKEIVNHCNRVGKPVIVATQMLESMAKNPRPTRAEVSDVTNAVYDGADCVMLSGETAKGNYPIETVKTMNSIIRSAEDFNRAHPHTYDTAVEAVNKSAKSTPYQDVAAAAVEAANEGDAAAIILMTETGNTARMMAQHRPNVPILCFVKNHKVGRQLMISRACHPIFSREELADAPFAGIANQAAAMKAARELNFLSSGDKFVMVNASTEHAHLGFFANVSVGIMP